MSARCLFAFGLAIVLMLSSRAESLDEASLDQGSLDEASLQVMTWNIWHGGREDGEQEGPQRVIDVIRDSGADLIAMQETYGSGRIISEGLGFHFQERGTNLSIHSRYPIVEDISVFDEFKCIGSLVELPNGQRIAFYCIWLPYASDIWLPGSRDGKSDTELQAACQPSCDDLRAILEAIHKRLGAERYRDVSLMIAGDFNSMSHLDYAAVWSEQFGNEVDWLTSHVLIDAGMRDAYRETHPVVNRQSDSTWSPRFPDQEQDRIDFIYYQSEQLRATESRVIREHAIKFPSDHAAVLATFRNTVPTEQSSESELRAMTYNIRRGWGTDGETDLSRQAAVIKQLNVDFVGLQEVDLNARRSGSINQAASLGAELGMHAAFAPFMDFQGGEYGMGLLSKHPIREVKALKLPTGNEPRVALIVKVLLPNDQPLTLINVHFDWVSDDRFRFAQAQALAEELKQLNEPWVLLGDFNDTVASRTMDLFQSLAVEADKSDEERLTWPAEKPEVEIDFILAAPKNRWSVGLGIVINEPIASDHRPVIADLILLEQMQENGR